MSDSNSSNIKTGWVLAILIGIVLVVVGFYFFNFNFHLLKNENWPDIFKNLSKNTGSWGTFGDYVGGILNPVIAAFAFYLIAETYKLQKRELESTSSLLEVSTDAQNKQIKLAALTALLNSNLMRIDTLKAESFVFKGKLPIPKEKSVIERGLEKEKKIMMMITNPDLDKINNRLVEIESAVEKLQLENVNLEKQIKFFLQ